MAYLPENNCWRQGQSHDYVGRKCLRCKHELVDTCAACGWDDSHAPDCPTQLGRSKLVAMKTLPDRWPFPSLPEKP